jgi:hypothetical protein
MKSFKWMYYFIRDVEITPPLVGFTAGGDLTVKANMPKEVPDKIAKWLLKRKLNQSLKDVIAHMVSPRS